MTPYEFFQYAPLRCCPACGHSVGFIPTFCEPCQMRTLPVVPELSLSTCEAQGIDPESVMDWYFDNLGPPDDPEPMNMDFGGPSLVRKD